MRNDQVPPGLPIVNGGDGLSQGPPGPPGGGGGGSSDHSNPLGDLSSNEDEETTTKNPNQAQMGGQGSRNWDCWQN